MNAPILGFNGASAEKRALKASRVTPPRAYALPDGSLVGIGLTRMHFIDGMDRIDTALHGSRLTSAKMSDFETAQKIRYWLALTGVERARQKKTDKPRGIRGLRDKPEIG